MEDLVKPESRLPSTENMQNPTDSDIILISSDSEDEEQSYQTVGDISQNLSNKKTSVESQSTCESHKNMNGSSNSLNLNIDEIFKKVSKLFCFQTFYFYIVMLQHFSYLLFLSCLVRHL